MKCRFCNSDIESDALFCPFCGKDLSKSDKCVNCGKTIENDMVFCPHCGTKQPRENPATHTNEDFSTIEVKECICCGELIEADSDFCPFCGKSQSMEKTINEEQKTIEDIKKPQEEDVARIIQDENISISESPKDDLANTLEPYESGHSSKMWLWILCVILLLGIVGGVWYFYNEGYFGNKAMAPIEETDSIAEVNDSIFEEEHDIHSLDGIKQRLSKILTEALKMSNEDAINTFFTEDFKDLYANVERFDNEYNTDCPGFWNGNIWDGGQDGNPNGFTINSVSSSTETEAYAEVKFSYDMDEYHSATYQSVSLLFENGNWYIDDVNGNKAGMKEYVSQPANETTYNGTFSMVGHVSQDNIHMNIEIDNTSVKGRYYYDSQGSSNQVRLEGMIDDNGNMKLIMYGNDGEAKGYFIGAFDGSTYSGQFVHNSIDENLQFSVSVE